MRPVYQINPANVIIPRRFILVEAPVMDDLMPFAGTTLKIDSSFHPEKWVNKIGRVIQVPLKMKFDRKNPNYSQDFDCTIEAMPGDIAYFDYFGALMMWGRHADKNQEAPDPLYFEWEGKAYGFLDYTEIFCIGRGEEIIPVNAYVVFQRIRKETSELDFITRYHDNMGVALLVGSNNKQYLGEKYVDGEVEVGETFMFEPIASRDIWLPGCKDVQVVQKRYIMCTVDDQDSQACT